MASADDDNTVEKEFPLSWDGMEQYYRFIITRPGWEYMEWLRPMLHLIAELRKRDYDQHFRAGQSLLTFIISRSSKHGLRLEQPFITFDLKQESGMRVTYYQRPDVKIHIDVERVELTEAIEELLSRLLAHPID